MKPTRARQTNYWMVGTIVFSLFCWLGLYSVWANLGEAGFELLRQPGALSAVEGAILIALNAFGLLALAAFGTAGMAALVRATHHDARDARRISRTPR